MVVMLQCRNCQQARGSICTYPSSCCIIEARCQCIIEARCRCIIEACRCCIIEARRCCITEALAVPTSKPAVAAILPSVQCVFRLVAFASPHSWQRSHSHHMLDINSTGQCLRSLWLDSEFNAHNRFVEKAEGNSCFTDWVLMSRTRVGSKKRLSKLTVKAKVKNYEFTKPVPKGAVKSRVRSGFASCSACSCWI